VKVFLDEGVPENLANRLRGHEVESAKSLGRKGTRNGRLLAAVEAAGFNAMVTNDKQMEAQQQFLSATNWPVIERHVDGIVQAVDDCKPGIVVRVGQSPAMRDLHGVMAPHVIDSALTRFQAARALIIRSSHPPVYSE
jgi:hypothetical protein